MMKVPRSTYGRSPKAGAILIAAAVLFLAILPAPVVAHPAPAQGCTYDCGTTGFITRDGLFYVEVGYIGFLGTFNAEPNGSEVYAYAITLNITNIVSPTLIAVPVAVTTITAFPKPACVNEFV